MISIPRMRVFAGPNGSGKSSLKEILPQELLGIYLNPDEIEHTLKSNGFLDLSAYSARKHAGEAISFLKASPFLKAKQPQLVLSELKADKCKLIFESCEINSYIASVLADFLRRELLSQRVSFTFETVMSSSDKIELLKKAQSLGFRTYLYYIATEDVQINISRVANRVALGGHSVPQEKITSRYHRSLDLLKDAICHSDRAYIFDNSGEGKGRTWLAEITNGEEVVLQSDYIPSWFQHAVLDRNFN